MIWANPRYLSFWGVLLLGKLLSIPVYPRGHGLVKQPNAGALKKWMYRLIVALSHAYICYTPKVRESLAFIQNDAKLPVDYNTLYNDFPVRPEEKTGKEKGIFFVGRVRDGCGVDVLISAIQTLREKDGLDVEAHIIGDGPWRAILEEKAAQFPHWLKYYGGVFDQKKITEISRTCRIGCGPGFMGLNVVHMLSLSLPVITHANLAEHMGPEPEYIQHGINGWLLKRKGDVKMLQNILGDVWNLDKTVLGEVRNNAYSSYKTLSIPPYHKRLLGILNA
ncbi:MAG: glycosyltransferase [Chloroflexi bacterium]|nr:glycosyltransferase [Chloroflexota bacterium]